MKLHLIHEHLKGYTKSLKNHKVEPDSLFRLCSNQWNKNFTLEQGKLSETIEKSLSNDVSGRLWNGEKFSIKSGILSLALTNEDLLRESFRDLFNDGRQLIMRVNRFIHHCDVIQNEKKRKTTEVFTHYQTYYSATLLLSLAFPDRYCLLNFPVFEHFCKSIGHQDIPTETDLERYYKIVTIVNGIISKDSEFMETYYSKLPDEVYLGPSLDTCYDFMNFIFKKNKDI